LKADLTVAGTADEAETKQFRQFCRALTVEKLKK